MLSGIPVVQSLKKRNLYRVSEDAELLIFIVNEAHKIHKFQSISSPRLYPSDSQYRGPS